MRLLILSIVVVFVLILPIHVLAHPHIVDVAEKTEVSPEAFLDDLRKVQVIFVGELHDNVGHHEAQLSIIDALDDDEKPLAIGLEMLLVYQKARKEILKLDICTWVLGG